MPFPAEHRAFFPLLVFMSSLAYLPQDARQRARGPHRQKGEVNKGWRTPSVCLAPVQGGIQPSAKEPRTSEGSPCR